MFSIEILYFLNLTVTTILVIATLYRVKLERDMVKLAKQNAKYREAVKVLYKALNIEDFTIDELKEVLKEIIEECENG